MSRARQRTLVLDVIIISLTVCVANADRCVLGYEIDPDCVKQFKSQAPDAYRAVGEATQRIEVDGERVFVEHWNRPGRLSVEEDRRQFRIMRNRANGGFKLDLEKKSGDSSTLQEFVENDRYWFTIAQPNGSTTPYQLMDGAVMPREKWHRIFRLTTFEWYVDVGTRIWILPLLDVFEDPDFRLMEAKWILPSASNVGRKARFRFDYTGKSRDGFRFASGQYWVELNPDNSWLAESSGIDVPAEGFRMVLGVKYQLIDKKTPFPEIISVHGGPLETVKNPEPEETTVTFGQPRELDKSDEIFYLPYYGLPESAVDTTVSSGRSKWILLNLGVIGIIVAIWLMRRSKRLKSIV